MENQGLGWNVSFSAAAGSSNVCNVTLTVKDNDGKVVAKPVLLLVWLSDAATGIGLTGTSASGTVTAKNGYGQDMGAITAKKCLFAQTLADGTFVLEITDTAKTHFYVCAAFLADKGRVAVSDPLTTANYG